MRLTRSITCENKGRVCVLFKGCVLLVGRGRADRTTPPLHFAAVVLAYVGALNCIDGVPVCTACTAIQARQLPCHVEMSRATCHTRVGPSQQLFLHRACNGTCSGYAWLIEQVSIAI